MFWWIVATYCSFFVKGVCGFANAILFSAILSFSHNNINISPVELVIGWPTSVIIACRERKSLDWKVCGPLAAIVLVGSVVGTVFLKNFKADVVKVIFGFVIIGIGIELLLREFHPRQMKESKLVLSIIGVCSGILCGLYGIGALIGAYVGRTAKDSHAFKANVCFVFTVESLFRIMLYVIYGILTWDILRQALCLAPVMLLGLFSGIYCCRWLSERAVKRFVVVMLIICGITLVINNL